jgi:hypothetical protein
MENRLIGNSVRLDPIVDMDVAWANVLVQVPFVGPVIHLEHVSSDAKDN